MNAASFNLRPSVRVHGQDGNCWGGWESIGAQLRAACESISRKRAILAIDCYPGVDEAAICDAIQDILNPDALLRTANAFKSPAAIDRMVAPFLTDDPVFGRITTLGLSDFLDAGRAAELRARLDELDNERDGSLVNGGLVNGGLVVVCGAAATLLCQPDVLVYADLSRREAQLRFRGNATANLGVDNQHAPWQQQYKRGFFVDWRVADQHKRTLFDRWAFLLDTNDPESPKLATGEAIRAALKQTAKRPFSVVPYSDPAPWGGHWMQEEFGLDPDRENFGWCFNCVPEENSLLLDFTSQVVELPAIDLVFFQPLELLGPEVYKRYGAEFPIRFDFLDTMGGGNLSLQVHPTAEYIGEMFGMPYTQDESYYFLQANPNASVYLGLQEGIDRQQMMTELELCKDGVTTFNANRYVNQLPARKHDHFHIPAGTVHCQGADSLVLEISATPYIFTFKLWDWGRPGLDGKPRPIHLEHGRSVIDWTRTTSWVRDNLANTVTPVAEGEGWREERTGLHPDEPLETRRHWFQGVVPHDTAETVNVLCLVAGEEVIVESPHGAFDPFVVRYAETFIVPAAVGAYTVRPHGSAVGTQCVTMKAFVRPADDESPPRGTACT